MNCARTVKPKIIATVRASSQYIGNCIKESETEIDGRIQKRKACFLQIVNIIREKGDIQNPKQETIMKYPSYFMKDYKLCKMEMLLIVPKHAVKENGKYISKELLML